MINKKDISPKSGNDGIAEEDFFKNDTDLDEVGGAGFEFPDDTEDDVSPIFEE